MIFKTMLCYNKSATSLKKIENGNFFMKMCFHRDAKEFCDFGISIIVENVETVKMDFHPRKYVFYEFHATNSIIFIFYVF